MKEQFQRTEMLLGSEGMEKLNNARVIVFGIGGVGGYVVEALNRAGVGAIDLVDKDVVSISNLNRQIIATQDTIGRFKVEVAEERIHSINPECIVRTFPCFVLPEEKADSEGVMSVEAFDFTVYDYIVDAIDTVSGKLAIIEKAKREGVPVISCMGTGNKLYPEELMVSDLYKTSVCPLAKVMRRECKKRGIESLKVVYSKEEPLKPIPPEQKSEQDLSSETRKAVPGSVSFVPAAAGLIIAGEVIRDLVR